MVGFEQLLVKARFEEAKLRDLSGCSNESKQYTAQVKSNPRVPASGYKKSDNRSVQRCYQCNGVGHYAKNCQLKNRSRRQQQQSRSRDDITTAGCVVTNTALQSASARVVTHAYSPAIINNSKCVLGILQTIIMILFMVYKG